MTMHVLSYPVLALCARVGMCLSGPWSLPDTRLCAPTPRDALRPGGRARTPLYPGPHADPDMQWSWVAPDLNSTCEFCANAMFITMYSYRHDPGPGGPDRNTHTHKGAHAGHGQASADDGGQRTSFWYDAPRSSARGGRTAKPSPPHATSYCFRTLLHKPGCLRLPLLLGWAGGL